MEKVKGKAKKKERDFKGNKKLQEAVKIIAEDSDKSNILNMQSKYPLASIYLKVFLSNPYVRKDFIEFVDALPENITMNVLNKNMKKNIAGEQTETNKGESENNKIKKESTESTKGAEETEEAEAKPKKKRGRPKKSEQAKKPVGEPEIEDETEEEETFSAEDEQEDLDEEEVPFQSEKEDDDQLWEI